MELAENKQQEQINPAFDLWRWLDEHNSTGLWNQLKLRVLGQDEELRKAAILIYGFLQSIHHNRPNIKLHFLIEGRSGCGKTTFASALRELLPCPVITVDASQLTPSGYRGAEAGDLISSKELEQWWNCGIVVLDELDKLMEPVDSGGGNFHREALENLLKMLDGGTVMDRDGKTIDCSRILFIGMGAFTPLRVQGLKRSIGFTSQAPSMTDVSHISKEDMTGFCGSEQFVGRFTTVLHFHPLGRELYQELLKQAKQDIVSLFGGCPLSQKEEERIIDTAMTSEFGCRSIQSAVWEAFLETDAVIRKNSC